MATRPRFPGLAVLRHRPYARFALCRLFTTLSWQMLAVAVGWQVYALTHDALALGLVGLSEFLPFLCLVLLGGHVADRTDRRKVLIIAWSIEALAIGALLWLVVAGLRAVWPIYLVIATFGSTRAFYAPSMQAMLPSLVPREEFPRAVAINSTLFQVAVIVGPALGGVLYLLGPAVVFGACLTLFALTVVLLLSMGAQRAARDAVAVPTSTSHQWLEGLRYVLHQRLVLGVISLDLFAVLFGGATALLPIFAGQVLHIGPVGLGLLRTAPGVGAAATALVLTLRPIERRAGACMFGGVCLFGLATLVFGLSRNAALSLAALFVLGCGDMLSVYVRGILVQINTPDAIRGRVSAINSIAIGASNELGEFESGLTARWLGAVRAVLLGGALTLSMVVAWMGLFPSLRRLDRLR
ncbi:MAG TPA: MFS transporter [Steroidobacteraceae bacterium]